MNAVVKNQPEDNGRTTGTPVIDAQNPNQQKLAVIWAKLLGMEPADINEDQDFFKIGGTSIKALMMVPEIAAEFGVNLLIIDVYEHNTIKKLSTHLENLK